VNVATKSITGAWLNAGAGFACVWLGPPLGLYALPGVGAFGAPGRGFV
jgi:hypothetical protein